MMEVFYDVAAVERRIAQITGAPPALQTRDAPTAPVRSKGDEFSLFVTGAANPTPAGNSTIRPPSPLEELISTNADASAVDRALIKAIILNESGFNPNATSATNAQGLMQLEPATAAGLGVENPYDPQQNVRGGTRYIKALLERFHGDLRLAVAAYNAGPGAVEKYGDVPPYAETQRYVRDVLASYRQYKAAER
ncbi:MAG: lytic transglycosylase domain-containing protein [Candidatus Eremiobacteraeota bacterium]|nr:lytic transglycosylase domain-containing protein [Candidatus Eremiobacteraeota bacterium]